MEADLDASLPLWRRQRRSRKPTLEDRVIARMLAPWLDRELANPESNELSEAHAARAEQLMTRHTRRSVALRLDRLTERAENPRRRSLLGGLPPRPDQIREAAPLIESLAARLRSGEPLNPCGVARLKTLFADRAGPCYSRSRPNALTAALYEASELLSVRPRVRYAADQNAGSGSSDPTASAT
jgi:hypothetical protein